MPKLEAFSGISQGWINQVTAIASGAVKDSINAGVAYMQEVIKDSPTGTPWHLNKNRANNFSEGARIGNNNPDFGTEAVDPNSGLMLSSVSSVGPVRLGGDQIQGFFGWIDTKESYFLLQDVGNYGVGKQSGMGLLNIARNPGSSIKQMGAYIEAEQSLKKSMLSAGFKYSGGVS
jgi:hypothetical protein